jgi:hypothetical protein
LRRKNAAQDNASLYEKTTERRFSVALLARQRTVQKMREAQGVYRLNAAELAQLHDQGVADPVINYMQQTYFEAVRREQSVADWNDWVMWGDHF